MFNLPCNKTIDSIRRKNRPPFAAFKSSVFMRCDSNRCPAIFSVGCMLVCHGFIDEYELFGCVACQLMRPVIPQLWVSLYSTYLDLGIGKFKEIVIKKGINAYLFFRPFDPLQHAFNTLLVNLNTKGIPQMVNLLVNVQRRTCTQQVKE